MRRRTHGSGGALTVTAFESPKDWGAVGDGTTDDTTAFQMAIDQLPARGGLVVIDEGDYNVPSPAGLDAGGRTLFWLLAGTVNTDWSPALPGTIINDSSTVSDGSITTAKLADNAVTLDKMEHGTQGDILYYGASGEPFRLGAGTSGQVLQTQGAGANPQWATLSGSEPSDGDKGDITVSSSGTVWTIDAGVIDATAIADNAIGIAQIASGTAGDILYWDGSGDPAILPIGTNGQVLEVSSGLPSWQTSSGGLTSSFTSTDQTITAAGSLTIAHGLGSVPVLYQGFLVCQTDEQGYTAGDIVPMDWWDGDSNKGHSIVLDATNINLRFGAANPTYSYLHFTNGTTVNLTNANWKLRIRVWL